MVLQDGQRLQQQIAEIARVQFLQPLLIGGIEFLAAAVGIAVAFAVGHILGAQAAVLPAVDHPGQRARGPALLVDAFGIDELLHQPDLVVGVEDGEVGFQPGQLGVAAQHARGDGMERAQPLHALDHAADQRADALLHLARGLVGEGHGQDLPRPGAARWRGYGRGGWSARASCPCPRRPAPAPARRWPARPRAARGSARRDRAARAAGAGVRVGSSPNAWSSGSE